MKHEVGDTVEINSIDTDCKTGFITIIDEDDNYLKYCIALSDGHDAWFAEREIL